MRPEILKFFAEYIEKQIGIIYDDRNFFHLQNRIDEIARIEGCTTVDELYEKAKKGITGNFKQVLLDIATNNETLFFRDPKVFTLLSQLIGEMKTVDLKVWSAACSTGQEILSFMMMYEELKKKPYLKTFVATDISERALKKAKEGVYTQLEVQRGLSTPMMIKYFTQFDQNHWQVKKDILQKVDFRSQNVLMPFSHLGKFNIILCRNILIYQKVESKKEILQRIFNQLEDDGILILGVGESMIGITDIFESEMLNGVSIFRKKSKVAAKVA